MGCNICTKTKPIPTCTTSLILGTIANLTTAVFIYIKDITTGSLYRQSATSTGAGQVTLDMSAIDIWMVDHHYEVWITLATATNTDAKINITAGTTTDDCLNLVFTIVKDEDNELITYTTQTVAADV